MRLRDRLVLYLVVVHLLFAAVAVAVLYERRILLPVIELLLAGSLTTGWMIVRSRSRERELLATGAELLAERDFSTRFLPVGQPDLDALVELFNRMLDQLRSERLRAEEQQLLLEKIVERSPAGVVLFDHERRVASANPAALAVLRVPSREVVGRHLRDLTPFARELDEIEAGTGSLVGTGDGRRIRVWKGEFLDRGFAREFWIVEELTTELRISERDAYEKVIRMLSHEINNSVGAVGSLLDSMSSWTTDLPEGRQARANESLEIASTRLRHLASFTRELASVIRIPDPAPSTVSPSKLLGDLLTLVAPEAEAANIRMTLEMAEDDLIEADLHQLEQVLLNVLRNAREAAGPGGAIRCEVASGESDVTVRVVDSGPGIGSSAQGKLFTPFFSTKPGGRGLGLTIVHEILVAHGATFSLRNASEGGAEFVVTLPRSFRG